MHELMKSALSKFGAISISAQKIDPQGWCLDADCQFCLTVFLTFFQRNSLNSFKCFLSWKKLSDQRFLKSSEEKIDARSAGFFLFNATISVAEEGRARRVNTVWETTNTVWHFYSSLTWYRRVCTDTHTQTRLRVSTKPSQDCMGAEKSSNR